MKKYLHQTIFFLTLNSSRWKDWLKGREHLVMYSREICKMLPSSAGATTVIFFMQIFLKTSMNKKVV